MKWDGNIGYNKILQNCLHYTDCYLLNHVILNDSQPCTINYLINLKEIIDFVFLVLSTSRLSFKKGNSKVFDLWVA